MSTLWDRITISLQGRMPFIGVVHRPPMALEIADQNDPRLQLVLQWLQEETERLTQQQAAQVEAGKPPSDGGLGIG